MKPRAWRTAAGILGVAGFALCLPASADFELTAPDGRRVLLKDDRTWQYLEPKERDAKDKDADRIREEGEAVLSIDARIERGGSCHFALVLVNRLRYPIRSLVPQFTASSATGAIYDTVFSGFASLKPGDSQRVEIQFRGVACERIARIQVVGGDACNMGELQRFSVEKGQCLARVRVVQSELVRFDK